MSATDLDNEVASHLKSLLPDDSYASLRDTVLPTLLSSIGAVAEALRTSSRVSQLGSSNSFGDDQLNVDVAAEDIIRKALSSCPSIVTASSEEDPVERMKTDAARVEGDLEHYTLAFDPLDGSSIIAPNWSVGTIIGVWKGTTAIGQNPENQIASVLGVYGPRTSAIVAVRHLSAITACFEVGINFAEERLATELLRPQVRLEEGPFKTRYFAPANMRAAAENHKYMELITHYISQKYTLRYSGGLVPDVVHALVKGHGVYISPVTEKSKAKLRRLYELAPIALIIECAGGVAVDPVTGERILGKAIENTDERGGLICGTSHEVRFAIHKLSG
ncbi:sedoheptulose-1,7-bisphosphatase [Lophiostoma macrostomum CBS 122681]|uniref:Sedoheptulose-1,7-bisphosphatase n=1 Tax=Lophiostoma macrostomum CBS 122681 TaxID=1314788 RepID=A0A6A6TLA3_9PLEO|nr:sedoheptulose-1,7-bisphosphatase [Lophiostoma macrostomum CBS 122681]